MRNQPTRFDESRTGSPVRPLNLAAIRPLILAAFICMSLPIRPACGAGERRALPEPIVNPHSTEICMNSRISYHGGWNSAGTEQMLANVLHAAARTPVTSAPMTIYAATPQNVYIYDAATHSLVLHKTGDQRSDATAAFELGFAAGNMIDAGAAMHIAQLESVALWTGTAGQLASCPRASATTWANSHWSPAETIDIAISFGIRTVPGLTSTLVAISSDGSLPNPRTDGSVYMDDVLAEMAYGPTFATDNLTLEELSQLLWASYGCSNHMASGKGGLVCSSAVANYYLTRRVYAAGADAVYRFHNRRPPGTDLSTRDHRIELVRSGDVRPALRTAVPRLPEAPEYMVVCAGSADAWQALEVGFAAIGASLEASTIGLQGHVTTDLLAAEQTEIRTATGIPPADIPLAVVSLGHPDLSGVDVKQPRPKGFGLWIPNRVSSGGDVAIRYELPADGAIDLAIFDCSGHVIRKLGGDGQSSGVHDVLWDLRNGDGHPVGSGVYFCRLRASGSSETEQIIVAR